MTALVRLRPNSKSLGIRLKLTLYNAAGTSKKQKGIRRWLREKVGEPPVLANSIHLEPNKLLMFNYLQNRGYFYAQASASVADKKHYKSTAVFDMSTGPQYTIKQTIFERDSSLIAALIDNNFSSTLLKPGAPYNLNLIKAAAL